MDLNLPEKSRPLLELELKVININEGKNRDIASRCKKLAEYSAFIGKIRILYNDFGNLEEAIKEAVKYCQKCDILNEFLEVHGSEVLNMILTEWNTEDAIAFAREEGREEGRELGLELGREEGRELGLELGREEGQKYILELLEQGLSLEDVKLRLEQNMQAAVK